VPPEFSGGEQKNSCAQARTSDLHNTSQILFQCAPDLLIKILNFKFIFSTWRLLSVAGTHSDAPMHLLVFLLLLALFLLESLHYECCSMMSLLLFFFPRSCQKSLPDSSSPWKQIFCIPKCRKSLPVPGMRPLHSPMPKNSGPWSQARSPFRGQTCMEWKNVMYERDCYYVL
jgi:hypothetical protein